MLTGGFATMLHIATAFSLLHFLSISVFIANLFGFSCSFGWSYLMQSRFVFKKKLSITNAKRFFVVQVNALLISQLISELFEDTNSYLRVLIVVFMLPLITYIIHRIWTYNNSNS
ncbi:GtrA family protein [Candidatus Enterovibrio altilux]|uniref:GtrA family protein n=1 Tax=Candidatus Enterovibrio altilux TaxID=1927128 RepID=UPI00211017B1|nr:GtrA family protein [Candidatus Enterovibrio luxaltus]